MKRIPLDGLHREKGARMVPFAGFEMPVSYRGIIEEHHAVRKSVGLFDISHMGVLRVAGAAALSWLDSRLTKPPSKVAVGRGAYALMCNERGETLDDLIFYRTGEHEVFLILNASNKESDFAWLRNKSPADLSFDTRFDSHCLFALQGFRAEDFCKATGIDLPLSTLYATREITIGGIEALYFVSGYTGERGFEVSVPNHCAERLFRYFLEAGQGVGIQLCGLGCRDTLRTEMGYSLYGHEISRTINPVEAGLSWAIDFRSDFVGRDALLEAKTKPHRKLIAFQNTGLRQAPRGDMKILNSEKKICGFVSSGTFSPSLGYAIGLGIVDIDTFGEVYVDMRGTLQKFEIVKRPFYRS